MLGKEPKPDPRSPVQPGRGSGPYLLLAVVAAFGIWTLQQYLVQDSSPSQKTRSEQPTGGQGQEASRTTDQRLPGLFSADDYPPEALDRNEQGAVTVTVGVNTRGRVSNCRVIKSSASQTLDQATCRIITARARFKPALDARGNPVESEFTQNIVWRIAE